MLWVYYANIQIYLILRFLYEEISYTTCVVFHKGFNSSYKKDSGNV